MTAILESVQTSIPAFHHFWRPELLPNTSPNLPCYSVRSWLVLSPWTGLFLSSSQQPFTYFEDLTIFHLSLLFFKQAIPSTFLCKSSSAFPPSFPLLFLGSGPRLLWNEMPQTGNSRPRWDPTSPVLGAGSTTASWSANCMKNRQSPRGQTVLALLFAPKVQTTIMVPGAVLKLVENWWFSEGVRTNPIMVTFLSIFNLGPNVVLFRAEEVTLSSITYKVFGDFSGSKELCKHKTTIFNKCKQMLTQMAFLTIASDERS